MADGYQFPLFYVIPGFRLRLVLIGEQEVNGRSVEHDKTEFTQFYPLDGDAVHWMVERVQEQYTNVTSKPCTSARMSTATTPRRRDPPPPRPRSPSPSPPTRSSSPVYSPSTPERLVPSAPEEFVIIEQAPSPPSHFGLELEPAPLVDEPIV
jgi:hypothetical protein